MKRDDFLKMGALTIAAPFFNSALAKMTTGSENFYDDDILHRLVTANDKQVGGLLQSVNEDSVTFSRRVGYDFAVLTASYCFPDSAYYHNPDIISKLEIIAKVLTNHQSADGTVNIGNLESPPDTAFLVEPLSAGAYLLAKDNSKELGTVNESIKLFLLKAGDGLTTGGVHTPNHRWVICAALARLNALYPAKKYLDRIAQWMGEGVFMDNDGHYPERSALYGGVENNSLITMARLLNKPFLFEQVRKNLDMTWYYLEPNGDLVTTDSRRQDQYIGKRITSYYLHYRYLAIRDNNRTFAGIARLIENIEGFDKEILDRSLFQFMENSLLQKEMPQPVLPSVNYEKLFPTSHLLRIRRDKTTTTLFGGVDWPLIIASGRSDSPNFFSYRKGNAILKYMRLSSGFFSMGYFYSEGLEKKGKVYKLHKKLTVPYYQPLPADKRNSKGDYTLSPSIDDRFWNKMDFKNRPVSNTKDLETTITLVESNGSNELSIRVQGLAGVPVTVEFCFKEGGNLSGVTTPDSKGNSFLEKGMGTYEFGGDTIRFGPGGVVSKEINALEGERYTTHFGSLRTEGMHVFISGITPFEHRLTIS